MKASDLRIGNYVNEWLNNDSPNDKKIQKVITVEYSDIFICSDDSNRYSPIPLTEDWLEKFGLVCDKDADEFEEWYNPDVESWFILKDKVGGYYYPYGSSIEIDFVHQLQNLYFALTGEELTLKEK